MAAEVKDFDGAALLGKQEAAHLDLYSQYALVALRRGHGRLRPRPPTARSTTSAWAVYVGSGTGGINAFADNCHTIAERGPASAPPRS